MESKAVRTHLQLPARCLVRALLRQQRLLRLGRSGLRGTTCLRLRQQLRLQRGGRRGRESCVRHARTASSRRRCGIARHRGSIIVVVDTTPLRCRCFE